MTASKQLTETDRRRLSRMKQESINRSVQALNQAVSEGRLQPLTRQSEFSPADRIRRPRPSTLGVTDAPQARNEGEASP